MLGFCFIQDQPLLFGAEKDRLPGTVHGANSDLPFALYISS